MNPIPNTKYYLYDREILWRLKDGCLMLSFNQPDNWTPASSNDPSGFTLFRISRADARSMFPLVFKKVK